MIWTKPPWLCSMLIFQGVENHIVIYSWNSKQPFLFFDGCFNWMIPNHYIKKIGCFTKHSLKDGRLGYKVTLPKTGKAFAPQKKAGPQKETASCIPTIHFRVRTDDPPENRASQKEIGLPTIDFQGQKSLVSGREKKVMLWEVLVVKLCSSFRGSICCVFFWEVHQSMIQNSGWQAPVEVGSLSPLIIQLWMNMLKPANRTANLLNSTWPSKIRAFVPMNSSGLGHTKLAANLQLLRKKEATTTCKDDLRKQHMKGFIVSKRWWGMGFLNHQQCMSPRKNSDCPNLSGVSWDIRWVPNWRCVADPSYMSRTTGGGSSQLGVRIVRITPIDMSHKYRPFGRGEQPLLGGLTN